ncbi:unnamed protein product [Plutella xylostella]|uniref:(diamondback moth) hypothetical protein n=1 Tax=Plutella xylostella TaxID=51655 RepID=A0A8S4E9A8_PLUXY|nr:unnamed protein product [Plutella xylostella]
MLSMESLWSGCEGKLRGKGSAERGGCRLARRKGLAKSLIPQGLMHQQDLQPKSLRRSRSGTWPFMRAFVSSKQTPKSVSTAPKTRVPNTRVVGAHKIAVCYGPKTQNCKLLAVGSSD